MCIRLKITIGVINEKRTKTTKINPNPNLVLEPQNKPYYRNTEGFFYFNIISSPRLHHLLVFFA